MRKPISICTLLAIIIFVIMAAAPVLSAPPSNGVLTIASILPTEKKITITAQHMTGWLANIKKLLFVD